MISPYAFRRLLAGFFRLHLLELSAEDSIEKRTFPRALSTNDSDDAIISALTD